MKVHQIRLSRDDNDMVRNTATAKGLTKDRYLAEVAERVGEVPADPDFVVTHVFLPDETWDRLTQTAKIRGITVSALVAELARA